jgi:hypothetical protein
VSNNAQLERASQMAVLAEWEWAGTKYRAVAYSWGHRIIRQPNPFEDVWEVVAVI